MYANVNFNCPLTLGELRELVNNGKLSKFPDDIQINMCIDINKENAIYDWGKSFASIMSVVGNKDEINFYNYI